MTYGFLFTKTQSYCRAFGKPTRQPLLLSFTVKYMHYILIPNCSPPFFHSLSPALSLFFFFYVFLHPSFSFTADRRCSTDRQPATDAVLRNHGKQDAAEASPRLQHSLQVQRSRPQANVRREYLLFFPALTISARVLEYICLLRSRLC